MDGGHKRGIYHGSISVVLVSSDSSFHTDDGKQSGSEETETLYIINSTGDLLGGWGIRERCVRNDFQVSDTRSWVWGSHCHLLTQRLPQEEQVWMLGVFSLGLWNIRGLWGMRFCRDFTEKLVLLSCILPFSFEHLPSMHHAGSWPTLTHVVLFFALIRQMHENMSVYSYAKQSAQPGNSWDSEILEFWLRQWSKLTFLRSIDESYEISRKSMSISLLGSLTRVCVCGGDITRLCA